MKHRIPKVLQVASYFLSLEPTFLRVTELHYAMFLYDIRSRYLNKSFAFFKEEKTISLHGILYKNLKGKVGSSPNAMIRYSGSGLEGYRALLSDNEKAEIEAFYSEAKQKLSAAHYSERELLQATDIPITQNIITNLWMEHFFVLTMERMKK